MPSHPPPSPVITEPCQITRQASTPVITEPCQITRQAQAPWKMPRGCKHRQTKEDCAICRDHEQTPRTALQEAAQPAQPPNPSPLCLASFPNLFIVRLLPQHSAPRLRAALLWRSSSKGTTVVVLVSWSHAGSMHWLCRSVSPREFNESDPRLRAVSTHRPGRRMPSPRSAQAETRDRNS